MIFNFLKTIILIFSPFLLYSQASNYIFDDLNRLIRVENSNGNIEQYYYDQLGNRIQKIVVINCERPTALLSGNQSIDEGEWATLNIEITGQQPVSMTLSDGGYFGSMPTGTNDIGVKPLSTTTYSISEISNACGLGTASGSAIVTVIPMILLPDLVIESFEITRYSEKEIGYRVVIKNIGRAEVDMTSFVLGILGSTNDELDEGDDEKSAIGMNASSPPLLPNELVTMFLTAPINYASNEHYFIVMADYMQVITESDITNNKKTLLVKKCSDSNNNDIVLDGSLSSGYYSAKGKIILNPNTVLSANTVIAARTIEGFPNMTADQNNISILQGTCISPPGYNPGDTPGARKVASEKTVLSFVYTTNPMTIGYELSESQTISISLWNKQGKVKDLEINKDYRAGKHEIGVTIPESEFSYIFLETEEGKYVKHIK
jgi:YD repeat-containing protein